MQKRLPNRHEIISIFAVITFMTYGWTLLGFLWKLPSWLKYLAPGEILILYSYSLLANFIESMVFLLFILFWCVILPARFLRDVFILRGTIFVISMLGAIMLTLAFSTGGNASPAGIMPAWLVTLILSSLLLVLLDLLSRNVRSVASALLWISDRLIVFLYVNLPLSLFALAAVAIRNLA